MGHNISIPETLLAEVRSAAEAEQRSADELVQEAVERHLRRKRLDKLYAYGESRAREEGIPASAVDGIIKEERRERAKLTR